MSHDDSSDMPAWARYLLLGVFFLLVLPIAIYGMYRQIFVAQEIAPRIQKDLLDPYQAALAQGDFEKARSTYTTTEYQRRVSVEEYRQGIEKFRNEFGEISLLSLHECTETKEPGRPWFQRCVVHYHTSKGVVAVSFEVVEQKGQYLIDRTFRYGPAGQSRVEAVL